MKTQEEIKQFALNAIKPYFKDPSLCGYEDGCCRYITEDGRNCVFGKFLLNPKEFGAVNADQILEKHGQEVLKEEARDFLNPYQWQLLQQIHDALAFKPTRGHKDNYQEEFEKVIEKLGLFTYEELIA